MDGNVSDRVIDHPGEFDHHRETPTHDIIRPISQQCPDPEPK